MNGVLPPRGPEVDVQVMFNLVPSIIYRLYYRGNLPLLRIRLRNTLPVPRNLTVSCSMQSFSEEMLEPVTLEGDSSSNAEATVYFQPVMKTEALRHQTGSAWATITVQVWDVDTGFRIWAKTPSIFLLDQYMLPIRLKDPTTGAMLDMLNYLTALVTETERSIDGYRKRIADVHPDHSIWGYYKPVRSQVRAVYEALKRDDKLAYAPSQVTRFPEGDFQYVHPPRRCMEVGVGNCLETVLLFCSLLKAIGLQTAIVWTPEHAILGWNESGSADNWVFLDTVQAGLGDFDTGMEAGKLFVEEHLNACDGAFRILRVNDLRARGITPLDS